MSLETGATVQDVRDALNDIDEQLLATNTIQRELDKQHAIVERMLPTDWEERPDEFPPDLIKWYVIERAKRGSFHSSPAEVRRQALDAAVSYDLQAFRGRLNSDVEDIEALLWPDRGGESAAFGDATEHGSGQDIQERLRRYTKYPGAFRR